MIAPTLLKAILKISTQIQAMYYAICNFDVASDDVAFK